VHDPGNTYIPVQAAHYLHEHIAGSRLVISDEWGRPLLGDELWRTIEDFCRQVVTQEPAGSG